MTGRPSENRYIETIIAEHAAEFSIHEIPDEIIEKAKLVLLDTIGVGIAGSNTNYYQKYYSTLKEFHCNNPSSGSTVLTSESTDTPLTATFLNSSAASATEFYEGTQGAGMPGIHVIPPALAIAEQTNQNGRKLIEAIVLGYELSVRIGEAIRPMKPGLHTHGAWAPIGAAISVGHLLGFNKTQFINAIQISVNPFLVGSSYAAGEGATVRNTYSGQSAVHGVQAAFLAKSGFTGVSNAIIRCLLPYTRDSKTTQEYLEDLFADIGDSYYLSDSRFKFHASASYSHSPADAVINLQKSHNFNLDEIDEIIVRTMEYGSTSRGNTPKNALSAKFSISYVIAALLIKGTSGLDAFSEDNIDNTEIQEMVDQVTVVTTEKYKELSKDNHWSAEVEIIFTNGESISDEVIDSKGYGKNSVTSTEVIEKFDSVSQRYIDVETASSIRESITNLQEIDDCALVLKPLRSD